ncbi:alpha/beta hydrolase fold protein [Listeria floridensis FSL S10-1187]|uniref:Alpha/beta hydrolase fold protein n=1 Tax=Listeria floridensis FSL S10-1187 TaxID=1265817 RepID=A0ABN0RHN7_9LIST|nr:alpha/beta hydrolase [Listeria floridensis]EUJ33365.1 alpha/beta hydrolase fold protein [Listeria floridensis FSL S10-1187]
MKQEWLNTGNAEIYLESAGSGEAVIFLHAGVADHRMWRKEWEVLKENHQVINLDLPGFGKSKFLTKDFSYIEMLESILEYFKLARVSFVAASYGGKIALQFFCARPNLVNKLVLISPAASGLAESPRLIEFEEAEEKLLEAGKLEDAALLNAHVWASNADQTVQDLIYDMQLEAFQVEIDLDVTEKDAVENLLALYQNQTAPVLLINGADDLPDFLEIAEHLAGKTEQVERIILPNTAHLPNLEQPDQIASRISKFLS